MALYGKHRDANAVLPSPESAANSKLPCRDPEAKLQRSIPAKKGIVLLGTSIGSPKSISSQCLRLVEAMTADIPDLAILEDYPQAYCLRKSARTTMATFDQDQLVRVVFRVIIWVGLLLLGLGLGLGLRLG